METQSDWRETEIAWKHVLRVNDGLRGREVRDEARELEDEEREAREARAECEPVFARDLFE